MTIHPEALKAARNTKGLSRKDLADKCSEPGSRRSISEKAIYRYETGKTKPSPKKAQWLAEALGMTVERLSNEPVDHEALSHAGLQGLGYVRYRTLLSPDVVKNYRLVSHNYGLSVESLVEAAPWMFTLLAEMSLADRKQRLADADTAFEAAMARLPGHLGHGQAARTDFENACGDEEISIARRDIFGKEILKTEGFVEPFNPAETNPFINFLRRKASEIGSAEIDSGECGISFGSDLPEWPVFTVWFDELVDEDWLARAAVERFVKLSAIPPELLTPDKRTERVSWLIDQIPADEREQLIERHDAAATLGDFAL